MMLSTIEKVLILKSVHIFAETPEEALAEGKAAGLKSPALEKFAREKLRLR